jgi:hypothetical protein
MKAAVPQAGSLILQWRIWLQLWHVFDFNRLSVNDKATPMNRKIPGNMGLEKSGQELADPRQEKGQGNEIADDPRDNEQKPGNCSQQAFGRPARNGFLVAGRRVQHGEYVGAAPADKGAACKDAQYDQRQDRQNPHKTPKPDKGCKVGKQEGKNEDGKVAAQARLQ